MQIPDKHRLDLWLDEALPQHGQVEPRTGLEGRLIATLRSREERTRAIRRWVLILGSPVLAVLLIAVLWRGERVNVNAPSLNAKNGTIAPVEQAFVRKRQARLSETHDSRPGRAIERHASVHTHHSEPRLKHFPSPRSLSPEEVALARYAAHYPQEAALVAKEQQEFDEEIQKSEQQSNAGPEISNE